MTAVMRRTSRRAKRLILGTGDVMVAETALRKLSGFVHSAGGRTEMRKLFLAGLVVAALVGLAWLVLRPHEPVYQGKTLSFWMVGYDGGRYNRAHPKGPPPTLLDANEAIRQIGTNAIPTLLRMLRERDSEFKSAMMGLLWKQHLIRIPFSSYPRNYTALEAFKVLGPGAGIAVPRLIEMFETDTGPFTQQAVPVILGCVGKPAEAAIPTLLRALTHTNEIVRKDAIFALRRIRAEPKLVVPALIKCLDDPDIVVRASAARALGAFGGEAQPAVPALLELWRREPPRPTSGWRVTFVNETIVNSSWNSSPLASRSSYSDVGDQAGQALQAIDPEVAAEAGVQ